MDRISIRVEKDGPVTSVKMTPSFLGLPLFKVHAFFVDGLLVDTGFIHGRDRFLEVCDTLRPHTVVNTHHHEDHTGNNFWIMKKLGFLPLAHPKTSTYMAAPSQWIRLYRRVLWGTPPPSETGQVDSEIQTSAYHFSVISTPGHADDHICLYEPNEGWLFSGDLFIGEQLRYLREDENIHAVLDSLKKVAALRPKKMFCAFSGLVEKPAEALHHKIDYLETLQGEIEDKVRQGLSRQEIRRKLLGPGDRFRLITGGQISKQNLINAFLKPSDHPKLLN
jgi:glyoxylase-like metal-dependent hydrolase (beta-lactamase superfamily II)